MNAATGMAMDYLVQSRDTLQAAIDDPGFTETLALISLDLRSLSLRDCECAINRLRPLIF